MTVNRDRCGGTFCSDDDGKRGEGISLYSVAGEC